MMPGALSRRMTHRASAGFTPAATGQARRRLPAQLPPWLHPNLSDQPAAHMPQSTRPRLHLPSPLDQFAVISVIFLIRINHLDSPPPPYSLFPSPVPPFMRISSRL